MRHSLPAVVVATMLFSAPAWAQNEDETDDSAQGEGGEGEEGAPAGSLADGPDPAESETSDSGPYAPKGATGDKKEVKKKKEKEEKIEAIPRKPINGYVDLIYLFGSPPEPDRNRQEGTNTAGGGTGDYGDVSGFGIVVAGLYDLNKDMSLGGRIPFTYTDIDALRLESQELQGTSMALGNPEIVFEYRLDMGPGASVPLEFGLGIPVAFGNPDPSSDDRPAVAQTMANLSIDAATGYHDSELYSVGRVPVVAGAGYRLQRPSWNAYAASKFVASVKIKGDEPRIGANGTYGYNAVGLRNVTGLGVMADVYAGILLGLDFWAAIDIIRELDFASDDNATPPGSLQFVAEPGAGYKINDDIYIRLSYVAPLGGPLNDPDGINALRLRGGLAF